MFNLSKIQMWIISALAGLVAALAVYLYIGSLKGDIASLQQANVALNTSLSEAVATANNNSEKYQSLLSRNSQTLLLLKELQEAEKQSLQKQHKEESETNDYIESLDKESFESKCYNMLVPIHGSLLKQP